MNNLALLSNGMFYPMIRRIRFANNPKRYIDMNWNQILAVSDRNMSLAGLLGIDHDTYIPLIDPDIQKIKTCTKCSYYSFFYTSTM